MNGRNFSELPKIQNYVDESPYCVNLWSAKVCEQFLIVINAKLNVAESRKPAKSKVWTERILFEQDYESLSTEI